MHAEARLPSLFTHAGVRRDLPGCAAPKDPPVPPIPRVPGQWSHVEINRKIGKTPHTLILDRGKVVQASATQITIRELGSPVVVPLSPQTLVVIDGLPATPTDLRRRMTVVTMRIDGGADVCVRASSC